MCLKKKFPFRLITFDVTNTLLNFKLDIGKTYGKIGEKYGIKCDVDKLTKNFKHEFKKLNATNPNYGQADIKWRKWWKIVVFETFKKTNLSEELCEKNLNLIYENLVELYETSTCWQPAPGTIELLNYLHDSGVTLGVISNFDPRLHNILKNLDLKSYFQFVLTSYEAGYVKPDQEIFQKAMEMSKLENLEHRQCLHIGDNFELDYIGAKKLGWNSILVPRKQLINVDLDENEVFQDLKQLHNYLLNTWNYNKIQ